MAIFKGSMTSLSVANTDESIFLECSNCGDVLPATRVHFGTVKRATGINGRAFKRTCRRCTRAQKKSHKERNPDMVRRWNAERVARQGGTAKASTEMLTTTQKRQKLALQGSECVYCRCNLNISTATVEHVRSVAEGGTDNSSNLVMACSRCNQGKSGAPLSEWLERCRAYGYQPQMQIINEAR
ncbi:HNH nuclease [Vibrio variabilis]|uniref:HNH nuclease n=1 Tax=Vibrio variabilis TaxID=990271 RepID=A0ABQ0JN45_9VIBR|nr:HNH nuclease [Vibrio variabilis]